MPRKTAQSNGNGATATAEPISSETCSNPFPDLDELLDIYAVPVAHEAIRKALPDRVHHHIRRLLNSDLPADRAELLSVMQGAKLNICFAVYSAVLGYAREAKEQQPQSLPSADQED